jgi:F-type H+-transporting ATPase subunit b
MLLPLTYFADDSGSGLGLSMQAFVIQMITFLLVIIVLRRFALKPIVNMLEKRRKLIEDGVNIGQEVVRERAQMKQEAAKIVAEARHEADRIIASGNKAARESIREAEIKARAKAENIISEADERIKQRVSAAKNSLENEIVNLVGEATAVVSRQKLDKQTDQESIKRALKETK